MHEAIPCSQDSPRLSDVCLTMAPETGLHEGSYLYVYTHYEIPYRSLHNTTAMYIHRMLQYNVHTPLYVWLGLTQRVTSGPHDVSTSTACAWLNPSRLLPLTERISSPRESTPSVEEEQMANMCTYVSRRSTGMEQYVHIQL